MPRIPEDPVLRVPRCVLHATAGAASIPPDVAPHPGPEHGVYHAALTGLLDSLELRASRSFPLVVPPGSTRSLPPEPSSLVFVLAQGGRCELRAADAACTLETGDLAMLASGAGARLRGPDEGSASGAARLRCGVFAFPAESVRILGCLLAPVVRVAARDGAGHGWVEHLLACAAPGVLPEACDPARSVARLASILFAHGLHSGRSAGPCECDRRGGLRDPRLARALRCFLGRPGAGWSVERLAREAGMSRSAFAQRFAELLGESPGRYMARFRLEQARRLLSDTDLGSAEVAARAGYSSEAAFSRAFKDCFGVRPGAYRRRDGTGRAAGPGRRPTPQDGRPTARGSGAAVAPAGSPGAS